MSSSTEEWTVLIIGDGPLGAELAEALKAEGQDVEMTDTVHASTAVTVAAPDMVVLVGDAASDRGEAVLGALAAGSHSAVAPVMVVGDSSRAQVHPNYRHGPVAALSNKLPVPILVKRVIALARDVPDRSGEHSGAVTENQLATLVEGLSNDKRSGTLDVTPGGAHVAESLLMAGGQALSETGAAFVARVKPQLRDGPGSFRFKERSGGHIDSVAPPPPAAGSAAVLDPNVTLPPPPALRVLILDGDLGRAQQLAQVLRDGGSTAHGIGPDVAGLDRVAQGDPQIVLMSPTDMRGKCKAMVEAIEAHPRARWASTLLAPQGLLWPPDGSDVNIDLLRPKFEKLTQPDRRLADQARSGELETRLEIIGPGRMLRAVARCREPRQVIVRHPRVEIAITLEAGCVTRVSAQPAGNGQKLEGTAALSTLFAIRSGRVHVEPAGAAPSLSDALSLEDALDRAAAHKSPIKPSLAPPAPGTAEHTAPAPAAPAAKVPAPDPAITVPAPGPAITAPAPDPAITVPAPGPAITAPAPARRIPPAAVAPPPPSPAPEVPLPPPPLDLFEEPIDNTNGSGAFDLASAPLKLAVVIENGEGPRAASVIIDSEEREPGDQELSDAIEDLLPMRLSGPTTRLNELSAALRRGTGAVLERVRTAIATVNSADRRARLAARMTAARSRVTAVPARTRTIAGGVAAVLLVALLAWPSGDSSPAVSANVAATVQPVARPSAPVPAPQPEVAAAAVKPDDVLEIAAGPEPSPDGQAADDSLDDGSFDDRSDALEPLPTDAEAREIRIAEARLLVRHASRLRRKGRLGMAESKYLEALAAFPRYPLAMAGVVRLHLARKDGREAVRWAEKLIRLQPNRSNNQLLLGDAYMLRKNRKQARDAYRQSVRYGNSTARQRLADM